MFMALSFPTHLKNGLTTEIFGSVDEAFASHKDVFYVLGSYDPPAKFANIWYRAPWVNKQQAKKQPTAKEVALAMEILRSSSLMRSNVDNVAQLIHDYVTEVKEGDT